MNVSEIITSEILGHFVTFSENLSDKFQIPLQDILQTICEDQNISYEDDIIPIIKQKKKQTTTKKSKSKIETKTKIEQQEETEQTEEQTKETEQQEQQEQQEQTKEAEQQEQQEETKEMEIEEPQKSDNTIDKITESLAEMALSTQQIEKSVKSKRITKKSPEKSQTSPCVFIMTKGERKGLACGTNCKTGNLCSRHKPKETKKSVIS